MNYYWFQCDKEMLGYNEEEWDWDLKDKYGKARRHSKVFGKIKKDDEVVCYINGEGIIFGVFVVVAKTEDVVTLKLKKRLDIKLDSELCQRLYNCNSEQFFPIGSNYKPLQSTYHILTHDQMEIFSELIKE